MAEGVKVRAPLALGKINAASKMRKSCVFPVLACFALVSCDGASAWFTAVTHETPVIVAVGDAAIFTCHTSKTYVLNEVRWIRIQDGRRYLINVFHDGRDQQRCDHPEYVGRTELMKEDLARGRAALKLFNVSVADEGAYRCYLQTVDYFDFGDLNLTVTALGSHPRIHIEGFQDGGIKAVCRSAGWYPEPTLVNKDDDGEMGIRQEENGLYSVEHSRVITENSNRTFACKLRTLFPNQEWETSVYVADGLFRKSTDIATIMFALSLVCFLAAVVIFGILYTWRKNEQAGDLDTMLSSVTIKEVSPKEEEPMGSESSPVTQALLPLCPDSEAKDLDTIPSSVTIKKVSPKEEEPIGCESSPVTQALLPLDPDSEDVSSAANADALYLKLSPEERSAIEALTGSEDLC